MRAGARKARRAQRDRCGAARRLMRRWALPVATVCLSACVGVGASAGARAHDVNRVATSQYLGARYALSRELLQYGGAARQAQRTVARDAMTCQGVLDGMPADAPAARMIEREVTAADTLSGWSAAHSAFSRQAAKVSKLTWSDHRVAGAVRRLTSDERAVVRTPVPPLCSDARAAAATAFRRVSSTTRSFVARVVPLQARALGEGPGTDANSVQKLIARYEGRGAERTMRLLQENRVKFIRSAFGPPSLAETILVSWGLAAH